MSIVPRVGLEAIFNVRKPLIGNLHCLPFPAIVGSSLKRDGVWWNEVEIDRVHALVDVVSKLR